MVNRWERIAAAAASASLLVFGACSGRNGEKSDSATAASGGEVARADSAAVAVAPGGAATARPDSTAAAASSAAGATSLKITGGDPEILQVIALVDQAEMRDGQLAERKAHTAQVKSYARELVNDHTKSLEQDRQVAKAASIDLSGVMMSGKADTAGPTGAAGVTAELFNTHTQTMKEIRQLQGAAFDSAFVAAQVKGHQEVLGLLQSAQAQNPAVQQHVAAAMKEVQSHLEKGQQLQQSLSSGASGSPSDTVSKPKTKPDTTRRG